MPSLVEIGPVVLEKKSKIGKVYRRTDRQTDIQTDRQTDDGRKAIRNFRFRFRNGRLIGLSNSTSILMGFSNNTDKLIGLTNKTGIFIRLT